MKFSLAILCAVSVLIVTSINGQNVVMMNDGRVIAAMGDGSNSGLIFQQAGLSPVIVEEIPLPNAITAFHDITIDPANPNLIFALDTTSRQVCSYMKTGDTLSLVNCAGDGNFATSPFSGVSAFDGSLIVSGGTGGITLFKYDNDTGELDASPVASNVELPGVIGHPDATMIDSTTIALSTDFRGGNGGKFGTLIVSIDVDSNILNPVREFRITNENSLGFRFFVGPANFPLVNAMYYPGDGSESIMYTANGVMQSQTPLVGNSGVFLIGDNAGDVPNGFEAVTVAVNNDLQMLIFGGLVGSNGADSAILCFDLNVDDPLRSPSLMDVKLLPNVRITSIASTGGSTNQVAYTDLNQIGEIFFEPMPTNATTMGGDTMNTNTSIDSLTSMLIDIMMERSFTQDEFDAYLAELTSKFEDAKNKEAN